MSQRRFIVKEKGVTVGGFYVEPDNDRMLYRELGAVPYDPSTRHLPEFPTCMEFIRTEGGVEIHLYALALGEDMWPCMTDKARLAAIRRMLEQMTRVTSMDIEYRTTALDLLGDA